MTAVEGGAYVLQESSGIEHRVAHDENTRIDRPAHVGDRIEAFLDDTGHAVIIRNIDQDERSQKIKIVWELDRPTGYRES